MLQSMLLTSTLTTTILKNVLSTLQCTIKSVYTELKVSKLQERHISRQNEHYYVLLKRANLLRSNKVKVERPISSFKLRKRHF
jgi:hypothetical protein